ncbi:MAG: DUF559 domain-containing protein [Psychrilyobacter sp.]|nr:DUF559 domain-containing protein [Psychrilyobacter sp.]
MELINMKKVGKSKKKDKNSLTLEEKLLWNYLKDNKFNGIKFKKFEKIGKYEFNFYSPELELGIEISAEKHTKKYLITKEEYLNSQGVRGLTFTASMVKSKIEEVLEKIEGVTK